MQKFAWLHSKHGSPRGLQGTARTGFADGWQEVLPCRRGSVEGQAVSVVGEADKQMDGAGIAAGAEEASAATLMNMIRQPQRGTGG